MSAPPAAAELRRSVLAASVLDDIDLIPSDDGVTLPGPGESLLTWADLADVVGPYPVGSGLARLRLAMALRLHAWAASRGPRAKDELIRSARLLAMGSEHVHHPGPAWVRARVMGGALDCGIGLVAEGDSGEDAVPLPPSLARHLQLDLEQLYASVRSHGESMGAMGVTRLHRDHGGRPQPVVSATDGQAVLRPVGGLDVVSLLATAAVRTYLAEADGSGMRATAVPHRSRGWYDLARIDPAFTQAAFAASEPAARGLPRPLLVTADEVALGPSGDGVIRLSLEDPAVERHTAGRRVLYR
ncbi:MAG: hypothetical protein ACK5MT_10485 [Actinomycetales bacterium]